MYEFIHTQNLARFIDLLEFEADPVKRARLRELLVEEEDRFGSRNERLGQTERLMARGAERVRQQQALIARLERDGDDSDAAVARDLLINMSQTLQLMDWYRRTLTDGLDKSRL